MKCSPLMARRSLRTPGRWLRQLSMSLILSTQPIVATYALGPAAAALPGQIALQDGKLTARLIATPLRQVMEEVSRLSGARIRWLGGVAEERPVSVEFTALLFPEALRRIVGELNFLLFYTSTGKGVELTEIWISSGTGGSQPERIPPSVAQGEDAVGRQAEFDAIPVHALIQTAVSTADPSQRVEAIAQLGGRASEDAKIEGILSHLAANDSDPQVRAAASEVMAGLE